MPSVPRRRPTRDRDGGVQLGLVVVAYLPGGNGSIERGAGVNVETVGDRVDRDMAGEQKPAVA